MLAATNPRVYPRMVNEAEVFSQRIRLHMHRSPTQQQVSLKKVSHKPKLHLQGKENAG
jgi:hypothetical protein